MIRVDLAHTRAAVYSECERYRYELRYQLDGRGDVLGACVKPVLFLMLNPSTATELKSDPTVTRCMGFARRMGARELLVGNIFAFRSTNRLALLDVEDPVGPENDRRLALLSRNAQIVCAWGEPGPARLNAMIRERAERVRSFLADAQLSSLALTKSGQPRHPLYLSSALEPQPWPAAEVLPQSALTGPCPVVWFASMTGNCPLCLRPKAMHFLSPQPTEPT